MSSVPTCQHLKVNGIRCGCPALRNRRFCYFHDESRKRQRASAQRKRCIWKYKPHCDECRCAKAIGLQDMHERQGHHHSRELNRDWIAEAKSALKQLGSA